MVFLKYMKTLNDKEESLKPKSPSPCSQTDITQYTGTKFSQIHRTHPEPSGSTHPNLHMFCTQKRIQSAPITTDTRDNQTSVLCVPRTPQQNTKQDHHTKDTKHHTKDTHSWTQRTSKVIHKRTPIPGHKGHPRSFPHTKDTQSHIHKTVYTHYFRCQMFHPFSV